MSILTFFAPVRAFPKPTESSPMRSRVGCYSKKNLLLSFDRFNEKFANNLCKRVKQLVKTKCKYALTSVVVRGLPCFDKTTFRNFSSSQLSMVSSTLFRHGRCINEGPTHLAICLPWSPRIDSSSQPSARY